MSLSLSPAQRAVRARLAAYASWANTRDPAARMAPVHAANPSALAYWERKLDPDGTMDPVERSRRAEAARRVHFLRLALKSSQARRARKARASTPDGGGSG